MVKRRSPEVPATVPSWMRQALQQCFSFDLAARPSVADLYQVQVLPIMLMLVINALL